MPSLPKLIVILGFTGSGKSDLAVELAHEFNGEIVSADSRQVYKEMDIGTGKVKGEWKKIKSENFYDRENILNESFEYKDIPHYLIDFLSPSKPYSVGEFKKDAEGSINNIINNKNQPIMAGGAAQYIYSLVDNWQIPRVAANDEIRQKYEKIAQEKGLDFLWNELIKKDPTSAQIVDKNAPRRIIRALEVIELTGKPFSELRVKKPPKYDNLLLGIKYDRDTLYEKIDQRVDQMIAVGLEKEATSLVKKYGADAPGLQTIGYKEFVPYLEGKEKLEEVIQKIKFSTHKYVRYQNTWFNKDKRIKWVENSKGAKLLIQNFIN